MNFYVLFTALMTNYFSMQGGIDFILIVELWKMGENFICFPLFNLLRKLLSSNKGKNIEIYSLKV